MISDRYRCIYVHIPKCAGTAIENYFHDITGHHHSYRWYQQHKNWEWSAYYKFAFVRNTYDWLVSHYEYWSNMSSAEWHEAHNDTARKMSLENLFRNHISSFEDMIKKLPELQAAKWTQEHFSSQHHFICNKNGEVQVDYLGFLENFEDDFSFISNTLNLKSTLPLMNTMGKNRKHYSEYYTEETRVIVENIYARDIEMFNFSFEQA